MFFHRFHGQSSLAVPQEWLLLLICFGNSCITLHGDTELYTSTRDLTQGG